MKSFFHPLPFLLALAVVLGGCEKTLPLPEDKVLFQAIEDNASAFNKKDVDGVMATIHSKMPTFAQLRDYIAQTFSQVELKVTISDLKVVTAAPEEARVSFKQKTEQLVDGHLVPLNIVDGVDTLRPDNGTWKIFGTVNTKVTRLTEGATETPENNPPTPETPSAPTTTTPAPAAEPGPTPPAPTEKPPQ